MPLMVRTPLNQRMISTWATYPRHLNVLDRRETAVQRRLSSGGLASYEPPTQAALLALIQLAPAGAVFFDIGARIGLYSALVDTIFAGKGVHVKAFEPTPATAAIARRLCRHNKLSFEVVELALADKPATSGEVSTLDAFTWQRGIDPHVVKVDVETNEPNVLAGGHATIARARPAIVCEIGSRRRADDLAPQLDKLAALGYHSYPLTGELPWRELDPREPDRLPAGRSCRDWLLLPGRMTGRLSRAAAGWLAAIATCDRTTNLLVQTGEAPPPGWNAGHPAPRQRPFWRR
ncbi:MAG TPA: FkbM family methyltransferase [Micromonosporaceae bacterium]|nr:FkbM family methyltransferase [Micromonosporaceae bacterium]